MPTLPKMLTLPAHNLGTEHSLPIYRYGTPGARPRVYLQAGLHADEVPANLVAHELILLLEKAEETGAVSGDITVIPLANPVGLQQSVLSNHLGRYDLASGRNYNRSFPDVSDQVLAQIDGKLGGNAADNKSVVAAAIRDALDGVEAKSLAETLQHALIREACDADIVLDMHTDAEALLHLYVDPDSWPEASDLAAELDASVVMFARRSGGNPFEETVAAPWHEVREHYGVHAAPLPFTTVIELRGYTDASDELAMQDAHGLFRFLQRRGAIEGKTLPDPEFTGIAAPFEATDLLVGTTSGVVCFKKDLGASVAKGDVVAEVVDVTSNQADRCRTPVIAQTSGILFTRCLTKLVRPGSQIGKIQGMEPIDSRTGYLLTD